MNDYQPTSTSETVPDSKPRPRRLPSSRRGRWISAAALALAATGISVGFAASGSTTAPSNSATTAAHFPPPGRRRRRIRRRAIQCSVRTGRGRSRRHGRQR